MRRKNRKNLREKMRSRNGFTLIEMLIVVAIIAILVAISIPLVSSRLEKARVATDQANERSARAVALIAYLTGDLGNGTTSFETDKEYTYDAENGQLVADGTAVTSYGQCKEHDGGHITVSVSAEGDVTLLWAGCDETATHGLDGTINNDNGGGD